jgi:hypothetical protein
MPLDTFVKFKTMLPLPAQLAGFVIVPVVRIGVGGCAFTLTVVGAEIQVLSGVLRTKIVCTPAAIPAKVAEAW